MENSNFSIVEELNRNLTMVVLPVTIFIGIEAVIGTFGNILILLIYTKRYERSNFRYFVLSMAVIDLTSCFTTLPGEIFSQMNWYTYEYGWICKVKSYFNVLTAWGSASILLLLAFDRYRKICKPLTWQMQPSFALKLCICSVALSAVMAAPITILWGKQTYIYEYQGLNLTVSICEKSSKYANDIYPLIYIGCVYILPVGIILFVVCSLNINTARELFGNNSLEVSMKNSSLSLCSSETTLTTVATETNIESVDMAVTDPEHFHEKEIENKKKRWENFRQLHKSTESSIGENAEFSANVNGSDCKSCSESLASVHTRVSFIANRKHSCSCAKQRSADQEIDFQLDIDISSHNVENGASKENIPDQNSGSISDKRRENKITDFSRTSSPTSTVHRNGSNHNASDFRRKQKTVIMLVLTSVFVITMLLYVILISFVAGTENIFKTLSNSQKVVFFFFWRLYFTNTVINPLLYGFLDPRFRAGLCFFLGRKKTSIGNGSKYRATLQCKRRQTVYTLA